MGLNSDFKKQTEKDTAHFVSLMTSMMNDVIKIGLPNPLNFSKYGEDKEENFLYGYEQEKFIAISEALSMAINMYGKMAIVLGKIFQKFLEDSRKQEEH